MGWITVSAATRKFQREDATLRHWANRGCTAWMNGRKVQSRTIKGVLKLWEDDVRLASEAHSACSTEIPPGRVPQEEMPIRFPEISFDQLASWRLPISGRKKNSKSRKPHNAKVCPWLNGKPITVERYPMRRGDRVVSHPYYLESELKTIVARMREKLGRYIDDSGQEWISSTQVETLAAEKFTGQRKGRTGTNQGRSIFISQQTLSAWTCGERRCLWLREGESLIPITHKVPWQHAHGRIVLRAQRLYSAKLIEAILERMRQGIRPDRVTIRGKVFLTVQAVESDYKLVRGTLTRWWKVHCRPLGRKLKTEHVDLPRGTAGGMRMMLERVYLENDIAEIAKRRSRPFEKYQPQVTQYQGEPYCPLPLVAEIAGLPTGTIRRFYIGEGPKWLLKRWATLGIKLRTAMIPAQVKPIRAPKVRAIHLQDCESLRGLLNSPEKSISEAVIKQNVAGERIEPSDAKADARTKPQRPAYKRDHLFLGWYEAEGESTFRSYKGCLEKWNSLPLDERKRIYPNDPALLPAETGMRKSSYSLIKAAIRRARTEDLSGQ